MAQMSRRSAGTDSTPPAESSSETELSIAGVDESVPGGGPVRSEVVKGAFFTSTTFPETASPGQEIQITGVLKLDELGATVVERRCRVKLQSPSFDEPKFQDLGKLSHKETAPFSFTFRAPGSPGEVVPLRLTAQQKPPVGSFTSGETVGPNRLEIIPETQKQAQEASGYIVQAALGAGAGAAASTLTGRRPLPLAVAGGGVAGLAKFAGVDLSPGGLLSGVVPNIPTTQIAVVGGAALAGALLLRTSGASEVLQPAGEVAGSAVSAGGSAVDRARREIERRR